MYCKKCGAEIKEGSSFCTKCGYKVEKKTNEPEVKKAELKNEEEKKKPKRADKPKKPKKKNSTGKKVIITLSIIFAVLIIGFAGATVFFNMQLTKESVKINNSGIEDIIDRKDDIYDEKIVLNPFEIKSKYSDLKKLSGYAKRYENIDQEIEKTEQEKADYVFSEDALEEYENMIEESKNLLYNGQVVDGLDLFDKAKDQREDILKESDMFIEDRIKEYKAIDLKDADEEVENKYKNFMSEIDKIDLKAHEDLEDEEKYNTARSTYRKCAELFSEIDSELYEYIEPEIYLNVAVHHVDTTNYPSVKLYIDIRESGKNVVPDDLKDSYFFVSRKDESGKYAKQEISFVRHVGEKEVERLKKSQTKINEVSKDMFLVEFEDNTGMDVSKTSEIETGYKDIKYGGNCIYSYVPEELNKEELTNTTGEKPEDVVGKYLRNFGLAMTYQDFSYISEYMLPGSSIYETQKDFVSNGYEEKLDSYEILSINNVGNDTCIVETNETYIVKAPDKPRKKIVQECKYMLENHYGEWKLTAFADYVNLISETEY